MSIIGEMYEEEIWRSNDDLKKRMEEFLAFLRPMQYGSFETACAYSAAAYKFKELFEKELSWNTK